MERNTSTCHMQDYPRQGQNLVGTPATPALARTLPHHHVQVGEASSEGGQGPPDFRGVLLLHQGLQEGPQRRPGKPHGHLVPRKGADGGEAVGKRGKGAY